MRILSYIFKTAYVILFTNNYEYQLHVLVYSYKVYNL